MTMLPPRFAFAALFILATAAPAAADDPPATAPAAEAAKAARPHHVYLIGSLRVTQPWVAVAGDAADSGSAYLIVENRSNTPDRLTAASLAGAASVAVVPTGDTGPQADAALTIPPRGRLVLQPGDAHLALQGLHGVAAGGPPVPGELRFERAGSLHLSFATDRTEAVQDDQSDPTTDDKPVDLSQ